MDWFVAHNKGLDFLVEHEQAMDGMSIELEPKEGVMVSKLELLDEDDFEEEAEALEGE